MQMMSPQILGWFSGLPDPIFQTIAWFLCCGSESQGGAKVDAGSEGVQNEQVSAVSSNGAEKSKTCIDILEPVSIGASLPGEKVLPYTEDDVVNDSSPIILSNEGLSGKREVETTKASSKRVDRESL